MGSDGLGLLCVRTLARFCLLLPPICLNLSSVLPLLLYLQGLDTVGSASYDSCMSSNETQEIYTRSFQAAQVRSDEVWSELEADPGKFRVLTGERTTGSLHIGHYFGSLKNRVYLQDLGVKIFLVMADYQAITDRDADDRVADSVRDILLDYMAVGIDPEKTTIFAHSMVPALNQLFLPFLSVTSVSELERNPTVKTEIASGGTRALNGLMLTYPVHQAADILFCKGNLVPGGRDQLPHIEVTRKIARRINQTYFGGEAFLPEPDLLVGQAPNLLGVDGRKMGKSLNNAIYIKSSADETAALIRSAKTDSNRVISYDPQGRPEVSNLLTVLSLCSETPVEVWVERLGDSGAKKLKDVTTEAVNDYFAPMRKVRASWESQMGDLLEVLAAGVAEANAEAEATLEALRKAMGMNYLAGAIR